MRASGGRSFNFPGGATGLNPNNDGESSDGLATCPVRGGRAPCQSGRVGTGNRETTTAGHMDIGIWNVTSLGGKEPELVEEAIKYRLDIVGVSETKKRGTGAQDVHLGWKLFYSGVSLEARAHAGVGILTSPRVAEQVVEWMPRSERIGVLRLRLEGRICALVQVYAPNRESEYPAFLDEVGLALAAVPPTDSVMLLGDLNAHVGTDSRKWKGVIGRNGSRSLNANGELLLDFCALSGLSIMNTFFRHRDIHKFTWKRAERRSLIDFIIVSADFKYLLTDVRVKRGAELSTDHHLVVCRLRTRSASHPPPKSRKAFRIRWERLREEEVAKNFAATMNQKFSQIPSTETDVETEWSLFKMGITGAAVETCGLKRVGESLVGRRTPWWTEELRALVKEKKRTFRVWLGNRSSESRQAYQSARKAAKEAVASAKAKSWENFGHHLEDNYRNAVKVFWQTIRRLRSGRVNSVKSIKDRSGEILTSEESILQRWREYFDELLNPVRHSNNRPELHHGADNSPSVAEVREAVRSLKPGKAVGIDEIRPEMLKALDAGGIEWLTRVFGVAWRTGRVPSDWQTGVVVPIFKKGDQRECSNYRGITLLSLPGKAYSKVLQSRLTEVVDQQIQDEQCGFRRGRGTTDQLFVLQQVVEKAWEYAKEVYILFVDLEKAYDRVDRGLLWTVLEEYGADPQLVGAIASLYTESRSCVRILGRKSEMFDVGAGLRQGCVLSPLLFIVYMDRIARRSLGRESVAIGGARVSHLLFADDLAIFASSEGDLQRALNRFARECESASMRINTAKSETMVISRKPKRCSLHVRGDQLRGVEEFKYLGVTFTSDGKWNVELDRRICSAGAVMRQLGGLARKRELSREAKLSVFRSIYVPTLTYGHELWVMTERTRSRVQAAEMRFLRRVAGLTLLDRVRSSAIRESLEIESLLLRIERSQLRWLGHILRMPHSRLVHQVWDACPTGTRPRGRPRARWRDQMLAICARLGLGDWTSVAHQAEDRDLWKRLTQGLSPRHPNQDRRARN